LISGTGQVGNVARILSAIFLPSGDVEVAVGRAELLRARPGQPDLEVGLVGPDRSLQAGPLLVSESLGAGTKQVADPVEWVTAAAAVAEGLLLDTAADLVEGSAAQLHDMKGIKDRDSVVELVVDGVLVTVERVQGGDLDAVAEGGVARLEPFGVGGTRAARDEVEEPGPHASVLVTG